MIKLFVNGGELDVTEQEISISWKSMRFSDGIRDAYTNDLTLPKTNNNINLLDCYAPLDNPDSPLTSDLMPALMDMNGQPVDIYIQIVSIDDDDIKICVYEKTVSDKVMGKALYELLRDDDSTIRPWYRKSVQNYNTFFRRYSYGNIYDPNFAQCHGSKRITDIVNMINTRLGTSLPTGIFANWNYLISTRKTVCPQNARQMIEGKMQAINGESEADRKKFKVIGGQHVVNDLQGYVPESDKKTVVYNRACSVYMKAWFSWMCYPSYGTYNVYLKKNGLTIKTFPIPIPAGDTACGVVEFDYESFNINANDVLTVECANFFPLEGCSFVFDMRYTNYFVYDDDYGNDLVYTGRPAKLTVYQWYSQTGEHEVNGYFDGSTISYKSDKDGYVTSTVTFPERALAYFGLYCNLPDITIKDLYYAFEWMTGEKMVYVNGVIDFVNADETLEVDGEIKEIVPSSRHLGQNNIIKFDGQEYGGVVSSINNIWLTDEHIVHQSPLQYVSAEGNMGHIDQYVIAYDNDGIGSATFNEVAATVMAEYQDSNAQHCLQPLSGGSFTLQPMGFELMTRAVEVKIETYDVGMKWIDFIYYRGRKYMVVEMETDVIKGKTKVTMLLIPSAV